MKKIVLCIISLVLVFTSVGCNNAGQVLPESTPTNLQVEEANDPTVVFLPAPADERLELAEKQNKDTVAWLTISGTTIDAAVLQSVDNDYYLRRDSLGAYSFEGCYFADYECRFGSDEDRSRNLVIYGHTFQDDEEEQYFAQLHRYIEEEAWALNNRFINLSIGDTMDTYEIISAGEADAQNDSLAITAQLTIDEFSQVATMAIERSKFDYGVKAAECSQLLTLSTCTGDYSSRLLVVARLVSQ